MWIQEVISIFMVLKWLVLSNFDTEMVIIYVHGISSTFIHSHIQQKGMIIVALSSLGFL
jgi:hypothetical protein